MYQNSILLEGKQALSIKHIVCSNSLGAGSYSYQKSKFLEASGGPAL